jgi:hypothetical protein
MQLDGVEGRSNIVSMPREGRLDAPGTLHHVMARGIEGIDIFRTDEDRNDFLNRLTYQYETETLGIAEEKLRLERRTRDVVKVTKLVCQLEGRKFEFTGASIARFLGVTTSLVKRYSAPEELSELRDIL